MSYILDALKKAEAEEDPDLRASLELNRQQQRAHSWGLHLIAAALIGNLMVLVWLFGPFGEDPETPAAQATVQAVLTDPAAADPTTAASEPTSAAAAAVIPAQSATTSNSDGPDGTRTPAQPIESEPGQSPLPMAQPATPTVAEPVHTNLAGLSDAARARFPELSFSTHVYAGDPNLRAVVVNGERLTEGDRLGNLRLTNITETGVVFRFEDYLVSVSVLDDWD